MVESETIYIVIAIAILVIFTATVRYLISLWCAALCKVYCDCEDDKKDRKKSKLGQTQANKNSTHPFVLATRKYFECE